MNYGLLRTSVLLSPSDPQFKQYFLKLKPVSATVSWRLIIYLMAPIFPSRGRIAMSSVRITTIL